MSVSLITGNVEYLQANANQPVDEASSYTNSIMKEAGVTADAVSSNSPAKYTSDDVKKLISDEFKKQAIQLSAKDLKIENDNDLNTVLKTFTEYKDIDSLVNNCKNNEEINKVVEKLIKDIKTALNTGWSLRGIAKQQKSAGKKGLSERLAGFSPEIRDKGFENVSADEQKRAIKAFFKTYFEKLKNEGKTHEQIVKLQMQTFGRILINSTPEEKRAFKEVIKNLLSENISQGFRETLESIDSLDDKQYLAEGIADDIQEIAEHEDEFGNRISPEDLEDVTVTATQYSGSEAIERNHERNEEILNAFLEENKEKLAEIKNKLDHEEELTDEEKALLLELKRKEAIASGEMVGTADNRIIEDRDEIVRLLKVMNEDNWAHNEQYEGFYREVLDSVHEYITNNPDNVNLSEKDFTRLMDEATDGNYTRVVNNEGELAAPGTSAPKATSTDNVGYAMPETRPAATNTVREQKVDSDTKNNEEEKVITADNAKSSEEFFANVKKHSEILSYLRKSFSNAVDGLNNTRDNIVDMTLDSIVKYSNIKNLYCKATKKEETSEDVIDLMNLSEIAKVDPRNNTQKEHIEEREEKLEKLYGKERPSFGLSADLPS